MTEVSDDPARSWRWLEVIALSAFAVSQPLYALFGNNPTFLVAHGLDNWELVGFALAVLLVPAAMAVAVDQVAGVLPSGTEVSRAVLRGLLLGFVVGPPAATSAGLDGFSAVAVIGVACAVGGALFLRFDAMQLLARYGAFAAPLFVVAFLFLSPASALLQDDAEAVSVGASNRTSVVMLVFDQLPTGLLIDGDGAIVEQRYPSFARLAANSTWYRKATTPVSSTSVAMTSTLSGRFADPRAAPVAAQMPVNLFTLLATTHELHVIENVTRLCPTSVCEEERDPDAAPTATPNRVSSNTVSDTLVVLVRVLLPDAVADRLVPEIGDRWSDFGAEGRAPIEEIVASAAGDDEVDEVPVRVSGDDRARVEDFLTGLGDADGPSLHYLHLEKPHEPLLFLPDGRIYDSCSCYGVDAESRWPEDPAMTRQRMQRYVLQTMYVDTVLGRTLDRLEEVGMADDTMLIVLSDHGVATLPGALNREVTTDNIDDILPVPLFVRYPGQTEGVRDDRVAQLTDVMPTILDVLAIQIDQPFDGSSLLADPVSDDVTWLITADGVESASVEPDPARSAYVDWLPELFPDPADPWAFGPAADLVGTAPTPVGPSQVRVSVDNLDAFQEVVDGLGYVPAHVIGEAEGTEQPVELAVSVNGTIAGVGTTFRKDVWRVSLIVDPDRIAEGTNRLELFEVTDRGLLRVEIG